MAVAAERMTAMRARGLRELRLVVPDPAAPSIRRRIAIQVARLNQNDEDDALNRIEAISEFDEPDAHGCDELR
jgi:hypothetical protein